MKGLLVLGSLIACTDSPQTSPIANVIGAPGTSVVWADSTGMRVDGVVGLEAPAFVESDGTFWKIDVTRVELRPAAGMLSQVSHTTVDCTGAELVDAVPPRITFDVSGAEVRTVDDTAMPVMTSVCSVGAPSAGSCQTTLDEAGNPICESRLLVPIEQTQLHSIPVLAIAGPLHPMLVGP